MCALFGALLFGCGSDGASTFEEPEGATRDDARALARGDRGPEVERAFEYLRKYGYYENPELRENYPHWQPVVANQPTEASVFDEALEAGVKAFQRLSGLPQTGVIDGPTRHLMSLPRCSHPDEDRSQWSPEQKFRAGAPASSTDFSYRVETYPTEANTEAKKQGVRNAIARGFAAWTTVSTLTFTERAVTQSAKLKLAFYPGATPRDNYPAMTTGFGAYSNGYIGFNDDVEWVENDIESVALHEGGHAVGIGHSGVAGSAMYPFGGTQTGPITVLTLDDINAVNSMYSSWVNESVDQEARDIGAGPNNNPWIITNTPTTGGYKISPWMGGQWGTVPGGAVRIAVGPHVRTAAGPPFGRPWIVNSDGNVYRQTPSGTDYWERVGTGIATDIAVMPNDLPVIIGRGSNQHKVYVWTIDRWTAISSSPPDSPKLMRIAASATAIWVVTTSNAIWRYRSNGTWESLPGEAKDIGSSANSTWIIGTNDVPYIWSENPGVPGSDVPDAHMGWYKSSGKGNNITVATNSSGAEVPWITNSSFNIYRRKRD